MPDEIKLVRLPINTDCASCKRHLPFGSWAYYETVSETAICPDCGAKRGWSSKERANDIIKKLELQDYFQKCGMPEEKDALRKVIDVTRETQDLQKEVRNHVQSRLFLLERTEQKRRRKGLVPLEVLEHDEE